MEMIQLGESNLKVTRVGLGTWAIGGWAWGGVLWQSDRRIRKTG